MRIMSTIDDSKLGPIMYSNIENKMIYAGICVSS